jgi:periplasmic protein TonB
VDAAADLGSLSEELRGEGAPGSERANPVALEVWVNATGARPSTGTEKRELFSEDTRTLLVFPDAAVIALSAAVVPGQLIFLTNKENNKEVVCQVVVKRSNRPTSCYVEVQFTAPQADFWGVMLPGKAGSGEGSQPTPIEESVVSAETTEEPAAAQVTEPSLEEMELLREEVDALREQLKALTEAQKNEEEAAKKAGKAATKIAEEEVPAANQEAAGKPLIRMNLPVAQLEAVGPRTAQGNALGIGTPAPSENSPAAMGVNDHSEAREAFEALLPQPELDFSKAPVPMAGRRPEDDDPYSIYKPLRKRVVLKEVVVTVLGTLLLVGGLGFVCYKALLPMARRKATAQVANTKKVPQASLAAGTAPVKGTGESAGSGTNAALPGTAATAGAIPGGIGTEAGNAVLAAKSGTTAGTAPGATGAAAMPTAEENARKEDATPGAGVTAQKTASAGKSAMAGAGKKRGRAMAAATAPAPAEPESVAPDAPLVAAKMVRAAKPVYPPDAMRSFITGDVRINAEVEASGRVGRVTVISGPAALRDAAVEAMKRYEYEPATKGGKAVASQVTVTIKFWFDP